MSAGANAVLVAVTNKTAKVGLVLFEMRKTAARITEVMDQVPVAPASLEPPVPAIPESPNGSQSLSPSWQ